jgi:hypothetical protein
LAYRELFWHQHNEGILNWNIRVFESAAHMAAALSDSALDIAVTHWHGEPGGSAGIPGEVFRRLRASRHHLKKNRFLFLAGQYTPNDDRIIEENLVEELLRTYDMVFELPHTLEDFAINIATGLWNEQNKNEQANLAPFHSGFKAFFRTK